MPLTKPVRRRHAHRRTIIADGYEREDGLWDIEARMTDIKSESVDNEERGGFVAAGEPFHDMYLRLTIDRTLLIHQAEAVIDASPFRMCPGAAGVFKQLEGTRIGPGWQREAKERVGGVKGCTHVFELLPVLSTTAIQSLWPSMEDDVMQAGAKFMLNTCRTWGQSSDVIRRYVPEHYQPESSEGELHGAS